ncbi:MobF family relaxase [Asticcacaulis excentricus]|uniref:Conjugative relaxase domain protein n=1 Tax=Asticcacaulis excentricus (strain ATCC 15261 / DSM 4724 / KCTC 12464 / NCIMB 9791 / VKM B-1370 / CB 48) TaxID=573065 RepID=E8RVT6_ASTEC|nr:MobF family relaxase [Asticcacaulis excentricus]ADU15358.1 conjugative relaxase domain protein [Asticcacaulis excentricus CB 48]
MLKITRLKSASRSGDYYGKDDYYVTGEANTPNLRWGGEGAAQLGLVGEANSLDFKKLLKGINPDPDGSALSKADEALREQAGASGETDPERTIPKHAPGWDMTFSATKSASIMALVAGDDRIQAAFNRSVQSTMDYAEKHFAITRQRTDGGAPKQILTGNLTYATTSHSMSRAGDPEMHNHVVLANATRMEDGTWRALETAPLYKHQQFLGNVQKAEFAHELKKLGYNLVQGKTQGTWEIAEFSAAYRGENDKAGIGPADLLIDTFSKRHVEIMGKIAAAEADKGRELSKGERQTLILKDRPQKLLTDRDVQQALWKEVARDAGVDLDQIVSAAKTREVGQDLTPQRKGDIGLAGKVMAYIDEKVLGRTRDLSAEASLALGLRSQERQSTIFTPYAVIFDAMLANGNRHRIQDYQATGFLQRPEIVKADREKLAHITTQRAITMEDAIVERVIRSQARSKAFTPDVSDRAMYGIVADGKALAPNTQQAAVVQHVLTDGARYSVIHGSAGTGKTTTFDLVRQTLDRLSAGQIEIVALAPTHKAKGELADRAGIATETVQMFLLQQQKGSTQTAPSSQMANLKGKWLLVDEGSMLSNVQMDRIIDVAERSGVDKVIFSFDERQLAAMEAGAPTRLAMHAGASTVYLKDNVRQAQMPVLRAGIMKMADGKPWEALPSIRPYVTETRSNDDQILARAAVAKWREMGPDTKVVVGTNKMRGLANAMIRTELQGMGLVGREDVAHKTYVSENRSPEQLGMITAYALGQRIIFHKADEANRIGRHTVHSVVGIDMRTNRLTLQSTEYGKRSYNLAGLTSGRDEPTFGVYREQTIKLSVGDQLAWNITDKKAGVTNNDAFTVAAIKGSKLATQREVEIDGVRTLKTQVFDLENDPVARFMSHGYSLTANRAQGASFGKVVAVLGSYMGEFANQARGYVMASRPRQEFQWVTDDLKSLFRRLAENDGINPSALNHIDRAMDLADKADRVKPAPQPDKAPEIPKPEPVTAKAKETEKEKSEVANPGGHHITEDQKSSSKEKDIGEKHIAQNDILFRI